MLIMELRLPGPSAHANRLLDSAAVLALAVTVVGFGGGLVWWFDLFSHFRVQYAVGAGLLMLVALYRRRQFAAVGLALAMGVNLFVSWPVLFPGSFGGAQAHPGVDVRVATVNLYFRNRNADAVMAFLEAERPDVVVFQEVDAWWSDVLETRLGREYPHHGTVVFSARHDLALYSRLPWASGGMVRVEDKELALAQVQFTIGGRPLTVMGTHLWRSGQADRFEGQISQVDEVARRVREVRHESAVVLMGDLNATPFSEPFRRLTEDTGLSLGTADVPFTWLSSFPPLNIPIDHVLVAGDVEVVSRRAGPSTGSDHLPLVADLRLGW